MGFLCLPPLNETRRNECACHLNIWKVIGDKHPEKETLKNCVVSRPLNTRNFNMIIQLKIIFHKLCIVVSFRNFRNRMGGVIIPLNIEKNHWIIQGEQQRLVFFFFVNDVNLVALWLLFFSHAIYFVNYIDFKDTGNKRNRQWSTALYFTSLFYIKRIKLPVCYGDLNFVTPHWVFYVIFCATRKTFTQKKKCIS